MKQYEIWLANLPPPAGKRSVLLLSRNAAYDYLRKFVVAEITTTVRGIAQEVKLGPAEGVSKPCVVNCDNLRTVHKSALSRKVGALDRSRHVEVKRAVGHALRWIELLD